MALAIPNVLFQAGRIAVGVAFLANTEQASARWIGEAAAGADGGVMARAFGVRDVALGAATISAARGGNLRTLLALGILCDVVDCAATLAAGERIPQQARVVSAAVAAGAALNGVALLAATRD
ncbi:MAG: hypothetical protein NWS75_06800 [Solirubrobacteraceae bacterium]|nr:hypothetical protein [Solirubrobacteraceae bacterium]